MLWLRLGGSGHSLKYQREERGAYDKIIRDYCIEQSCDKCHKASARHNKG